MGEGSYLPYTGSLYVKPLSFSAFFERKELGKSDLVEPLPPSGNIYEDTPLSNWNGFVFKQPSKMKMYGWINLLFAKTLLM